MKKPYQCSYTDITCPYIDQATGCLQVKCPTCEHFDNGVRATGAIDLGGQKGCSRRDRLAIAVIVLLFIALVIFN